MTQFVTVIIPRMVLKVPIHRVAEAVEQLNLTPGETLVFHQFALGKTNKDISAALHITVSTVKQHIASIVRKSGAAGRGEFLARFGREAAPTTETKG